MPQFSVVTSTPDLISRLLKDSNKHIQANSTLWDTSKGQPNSTSKKKEKRKKKGEPYFDPPRKCPIRLKDKLN